MTGQRRVLLLEPAYRNKYPPVALMKLATYFRGRGDEVTFHKGACAGLKLRLVADELLERLHELAPELNWRWRRSLIERYIRHRRRADLSALTEGVECCLLCEDALAQAAADFHRKAWPERMAFDLVCVTTLFTFEWKATVECIVEAKGLLSVGGQINVGGVLATIQPSELAAATGVRPHEGLLRPGDIDPGDETDIDALPLDYSILEEIDYRYPEGDDHLAYTTRGCVRRCPFCAVPTLEPEYQAYLPLADRLRESELRYGQRRNLLLMDNNVLASKRLGEIVSEIERAGYGSGARQMVEPPIAEAVRLLQSGVNDRAYARRTMRLVRELLSRLHGAEAQTLAEALRRHHLAEATEPARAEVEDLWTDIRALVSRHEMPHQRAVYVDFNQGLDARLLGPPQADLLARLAIRPLRIAFDDLATADAYRRAIRLCAERGIRNFSNYLLYNYRDRPLDLYRRLRINIDLCDELDVTIYSFPMKYHPIRREEGWSEDWSHNRDYLGSQWSRKAVRALQVVLNSTKGKVGRGRGFFLKAFGATEEAFGELLLMPEVMILQRLFFEAQDVGPEGAWGVSAWRDALRGLMATEEWPDIERRIRANDFTPAAWQGCSALAERLLRFYELRREDFEPGGRLCDAWRRFKG